MSNVIIKKIDDKRDDVFIDFSGCNCYECGKKIHRAEWDEYAKMCKRCYEQDGQ